MSKLNSFLPMDFDITLSTVPVKVGGAEYILVEASGETAVKFRNAAMASARMSKGEVIGVSNAADVEPFLISMCLFVAADYATNPLTAKPVPISTIKAWPQRIMKALFEKVKEISDLDDRKTPEQLKVEIDKLNEQLKKVTPNDKGEVEDDAKNSQ